MGKWAKPDLSDLENDLSNNSMKSISWQLINIIPKKLCTKNKEKLSNRFWENWQKVAKQPNLTFFNLSNLEKWPLEWFNQIHLLAIHQHPPWEASWQNREKVIKQFLRKLPPSKKGAKFDLSDLLKWPLWWFNQINIYTVYGYLPKEAIHQKRKKVIRQFLRNYYFKWKVDDDGRRRRTTTTDDGRIGIRKAPLPFGWRS